MTRLLLIAVVLTAGLASAFAGDAPKKEKACCPAAMAKKHVKMLKGVVHLKNDDVRFICKCGKVVFVDPTTGPAKAKELAPGHVKADLILITHPHGDHFQADVLKEYIQVNPQVVLAGPADVVKAAEKAGIANMQEVAPNQTYKLGGFKVSTLPAFFEKKEWKHPQENQWVGYALTINGIRYYVTGDTQALPEMTQAKADVVFPLLFGCGGNSKQALKMAAITGAKLVVPVHHGDQKETLKKFLAQIPENVKSACYVEGKLNPKI